MTPPLPQKDWPEWHPPTCVCGHTAGDHGRASTGLHTAGGRCFRCGCERFRDDGTPGEAA